MSGDPSKPDVVKFTIIEYGTAVALSESMIPWHGVSVVSDAIQSTGTALSRYLALSPKERKQRDAANAAYEQRREVERLAERKVMDERAQARWDHAHACAMDQPVALLDVLVLHAPTQGEWYSRTECDGCRGEVSGYEYDMEDWPCQTFLIIEKAVVLA